jgi:penicillin-binding protein 1A
VRVVEERHAAAMTAMMRTTLTGGTGRLAAIPGHALAGKTGTSQDFRDAWFVGYSGSVVTGVWVGNDAGRSMQKVVGGSLPAKIWRELMLAARDDAVPPVAAPFAPSGRAVPTVGAPEGARARARAVRPDTAVETPAPAEPPTPAMEAARAALAAREPASPGRIDEEFLRRVLSGLWPEVGEGMNR